MNKEARTKSEHFRTELTSKTCTTTDAAFLHQFCPTQRDDAGPVRGKQMPFLMSHSGGCCEEHLAAFDATELPPNNVDSEICCVTVYRQKTTEVVGLV